MSFVLKLLCWRSRSDGEPLLGSRRNLLNRTGLGLSAEVSCSKDAFQHPGLANWLGMTGKMNATLYNPKKSEKKDLKASAKNWERVLSFNRTIILRTRPRLNRSESRPYESLPLLQISSSLIHIYLDMAWGFVFVLHRAKFYKETTCCSTATVLKSGSYQLYPRGEYLWIFMVWNSWSLPCVLSPEK